MVHDSKEIGLNPVLAEFKEEYDWGWRVPIFVKKDFHLEYWSVKEKTRFGVADSGKYYRIFAVALGSLDVLRLEGSDGPKLDPPSQRFLPGGVVVIPPDHEFEIACPTDTLIMSIKYESKD